MLLCEIVFILFFSLKMLHAIAISKWLSHCRSSHNYVLQELLLFCYSNSICVQIFSINLYVLHFHLFRFHSQSHFFVSFSLFKVHSFTVVSSVCLISMFSAPIYITGSSQVVKVLVIFFLKSLQKLISEWFFSGSVNSLFRYKILLLTGRLKSKSCEQFFLSHVTLQRQIS